MTSLSRRKFINGALVAGTASIVSAGASASAPPILKPAGTAASTATDEKFWHAVALNYNVTNSVTNLENGYWGIMATPVLQEYQRLTEWVNRENTHFARWDLGKTYVELRKQVAGFLNVDADEIALTRGATEALQALIGGYNKLSPGDTVLYADLDYSEMKTAMRWLADRRGAVPVKVNFPEPTKNKPLTENDILSFYQQSLDANPNTKLMLLTHLNNWTGLIIPVAKITAMAKSRGIDVILDAAHSVGQVDFDIKQLGCDFVGVNLHKWAGAPLGCGVIYIGKNRIEDIDTYMAKNPGSNKITARIDTGTVNMAAHMAIPKTLEFHNQIGTKNKEARLRYLRSLWVEKARTMKGLIVLTPDDPSMVAGLTSFRLDGITTTEANNALMRRLAAEFGVLTTRRTGPAAGDCIRVTPSFYNTPNDMMKLVDALTIITNEM